MTRAGTQWVGIAALLLSLGACGGDDDDGGGGGGGPPPASVTLSGTATYDFVPAVAQGLNYNGTQARPIRGATLEIISGATVLATTKTNASGAYSVNVASNTPAFVRVKAELVQAGGPTFDFRVLDNTNSDALYALDGPAFNTGAAASTQNVHAASGWGGSSYTSTRSAAPFAILDTVYAAAQAVLAADGTASFPALRLHWSTANRPVLANGAPNPDTGEIGTSFFSPGLGGVFLLGAANVDTEEYDRHVIVHEWGHYFEEEFSRSDSPGGPHTDEDRLDLRVAFSEGFATGLAGIVLADPFYRDTRGTGQAQAGSLNIEGAAQMNPGWYSEQSVLEAVYDLVDAAPDGADQISMSFGAVYNAMRNHANAVGPASIFTFVNALKTANPGSASLIDALVSSQSIATIVDEYGTNETNDGNGAFPQDVLPIYTPVLVNNPTAVNVCSTDEFSSATTGSTNKLGSRRYLRFNASAQATYTFSAIATSIPAGQAADPDLVLHRSGELQVSEGAPTPNCDAATPANCSETFSRNLAPGDYVLEVYEWTNTEDDAQFPPIGRTCFDVRVTQ